LEITWVTGNIMLCVLELAIFTCVKIKIMKTNLCNFPSKNGKPYMIHLNVHSFGAYYTWNETTNNFQFFVGEEVRAAV
jgi:hypothetical protein